MEKLSKKLAKPIIALVKKGVRDDINSTGSPWLYQPRIPKEIDKSKNKK